MVSAVNCGITGILDPATVKVSLLLARLAVPERMAHGAAHERVSVQPLSVSRVESRPSRLALSLIARLIVLSAAAARGSHTARVDGSFCQSACNIQQPWVGI